MQWIRITVTQVGNHLARDELILLSRDEWARKKRLDEWMNEKDDTAVSVTSIAWYQKIGRYPQAINAIGSD